MNGLEPSTFSLEGCHPGAQGVEKTGACDDAPATPAHNPDSSSGNPPLAPDLRRLVEAWPTLPDPVRAGILAMVEAEAGGR